MKITLFLAILVLLAAGTLVALNRVGHSHAVPLNCEASFHYQDATPGEPLAFDGALTFHFSGTQAGQFFLTGQVSYQQKRYAFSRLATFRYERAVANQYQLQVMRMDTLGHDDVPEGVFPRIFKRFSLGNTLTLFISPVDNDSVVIGNLVSPILVCQQTDK